MAGPRFVSDRSDPHIVHLDGVNLSRAWMLEVLRRRYHPVIRGKALYRYRPARTGRQD